LTFWWDSRSEIRPSQSSREWKFKSDNATLISCMWSIQDMIRESGIPSGLEIGGVITFCTPYPWCLNTKVPGFSMKKADKIW
jgi:hypothetical protein